MTATISLEELNQTSALQHRVDRKYLLDPVTASRFSELMTHQARFLEIDGATWFDYRSVYFDTPELTCYQQAGRKRRRRFKVRTRRYLSTGSCWLEVKTRGVRGMTIKDRIPHDGNQLATGDLTWIAATLAARGVDTGPVHRLEPTLSTSYTRQTLQVHTPGDPGPSRITIDRHLSVELPDEAPGGAMTADLNHLVVVETKGYPRPSGVDHLLHSLGARPQSVSKYGIGIALLRTDQSTLKWNHLLNTALAA